MAGLIGTALTVTVGAASVHHPPAALPSAPSGHPAGGTVAAPPARQPSPASPSRKVRSPSSPGDTGMLQMYVSNQRAGTAPESSPEKTRWHRHGTDAGHGQRQGDGQGNSHLNAHGEGNGNGNAHGQGNGDGNGHGQGNGDGNGNGPVLSMLSLLAG